MKPFANLVALVGAAILVVYFLVDDTPAAWLIRLSYAGALTAGLAFVAWIVADLVDRNRTPPP